MEMNNLKLSRVWEERWARFSTGLLRGGVPAGKHTFYVAWVRRFLGVLKPKRLEHAERQDVEGYLETLVKEGKAGWQVEQASRALELFCREVVPLDWAQRAWPRTPAAAEILSMRPAEVPRPPVPGARMEELRKRSDTGETEPRWMGFLEQVQERLRAERYAYRTEQTYLDWVRRFLIFVRPARRGDLTHGDERKGVSHGILTSRG